MGSLLPGTEVLARGLRWEVVSIQPAGDQEIHRLRCLDGALRGVEYDFLVPFERLEPITQEMAPTRAARLQHWRLYHQAFLLEQALGPSALLAAQPGRLRIAPYQLVPVMRVLHMSRPRLLIADGVGLGKTIEAGLILAELIARRRAHRILIVSPAGPLLQQWRREMRERFGLRFRVLDRDGLQDIRYATELGANPFDHEALGLISIDFAKQEKVLQDLANHDGYRALWEEQLGSTWREKDRLPFAWPVLPDEDSRWAVRAAIDALVADAYGLTRDQYRHILSSFSHTSYLAAPERCLAAFDELKSLGAEAFARKHDPYWDIPLVEQLPKPVIHFPGLTDDVFSGSSASYEGAAEPHPLPMAAEKAAAPAPKRPRKKTPSKPRS